MAHIHTLDTVCCITLYIAFNEKKGLFEQWKDCEIINDMVHCTPPSSPQ